MQKREEEKFGECETEETVFDVKSEKLFKILLNVYSKLLKKNLLKN